MATCSHVPRRKHGLPRIDRCPPILYSATEPISVPPRSDQHDFQCPGEPGKISRAVHLARLADGYPACRQCQYRDDATGLSERSRQKVPAAQTASGLHDYVCEDGMVGNLHEGFDATLAGQFAAGFGLLLRDELGTTTRNPSVAVAGDGRPVTQRHFAEIVEKLRWAGCDVIELGSVPCPALLWATGELATDGGLYVGNPTGNAHRAGIRFVGSDGKPVTELATLKAICARIEAVPARPVRVSGIASRAEAMRPYEARFADFFHGLRPLRFLLHTTCRPAGICLERLLQETACKMVLRDSETAMPAEPLSESGGHFAAAVEDDGQRCRLWDERGEPVSFERLLLLLTRIIHGNEPAGQTIVVQDGLPETPTLELQRYGLTVRSCGPLPSDVHAAMVSSMAPLGADQGGRIWYGEPNERVIADALGTLTLLLRKLSGGDRPLSEVLDAEVPSC